MNKRITSFKVAFDRASDEAGSQYSVVCPKCKDVVYWAESMWWVPKCSCGYVWEVDISATGTLSEA